MSTYTTVIPVSQSRTAISVTHVMVINFENYGNHLAENMFWILFQFYNNNNKI